MRLITILAIGSPGTVRPERGRDGSWLRVLRMRARRRPAARYQGLGAGPGSAGVLWRPGSTVLTGGWPGKGEGARSGTVRGPRPLGLAGELGRGSRGQEGSRWPKAVRTVRRRAWSRSCPAATGVPRAPDSSPGSWRAYRRPCGQTPGSAPRKWCAAGRDGSPRTAQRMIEGPAGRPGPVRRATGRGHAASL